MISLCVGVVVGILLKLYLDYRGVLPAGFDSEYVIVGSIAMFFGSFLIYKVATKTPSDSDLKKRTSALDRFISKSERSHDIPKEIRDNLDNFYEMWTTHVISGKEYDQELKQLEDTVKDIYFPVISRKQKLPPKRK